ncbi:hypothetical protein QJS10_CPB11g01122 [Acorus calamus]|uniref:Uncharacterized protein n=1 Tax=Acorus calamus TaxID=4465 RepID=A0AAV9DVS7_ACOCL|nr:hypothetical protein QJS10_CPB11g01122 [Acorus calamus]
MPPPLLSALFLLLLFVGDVTVAGGRGTPTTLDGPLEPVTVASSDNMLEELLMLFDTGLQLEQ